jgi:membrane-associated protein
LSIVPATGVAQRFVAALVELTLLQRTVSPVHSALISAAGHVSSAGGLQGWILRLYGPVVYAVVGGLLFLEVGIIIGFFIPGEIATILGGVIVSQHHADLVVMIIVVAACASIGNMSGYLVGRTIGPWLLQRKLLKDNPGLNRTRELIQHRGGPAVFIGRWIVFVRAVLPGVAGISHMRFRVFVIFSIAGGIVWGTMWVLIGYAAGSSYTKVESAAGKWSYVLLGVVAAGLIVFFVFKKRKEHREKKAFAEGGS